MKNLLLLFIIMPSFLVGQSAPSSDEESVRAVAYLSESELIIYLSHENQNLRIAAANRISNLLTSSENIVAKGNVEEHPLQYWNSKSIISFDKKYEPLKDGKIGINFIEKDLFLKEFGLSESDISKVTFRHMGYAQLDHIYKVKYRCIADKVDLISVINAPEYYVVIPRNEYNGEWYNFYVNGQVYSKSIYLNGKKTSVEIYSSFGKLMLQIYYKEGICNKIEFYSSNGDITKVLYESLSESEISQFCNVNFVY